MDSDGQSEIEGTLPPGSPPPTQVQGKSSITYAWVILFHFDPDKPSPFSILRLTHFQNSNFPWECIKSDMSQQFRVQKRSFSNLPDAQYGIFAKVERGELFNF